MQVAFLIATIPLVVLTLLPLWRYEAWWVRSWDFPRLQISVILAALVLFELVLLPTTAFTWCLIAAAGFCLAYQWWWILPYTRLHAVEVKPSQTQDKQSTIRILTSNVLTPNRKADALIGLVNEYEPDILVTMESDSWWQEKLEVLQADYPHTVKCPLDNLYGMHVYSKLALTDSQVEFLVESDVPSVHALVQLRSGQQVRVHFLHPAPPSPTEKESSSERDAEIIIVARSVAETREPVIVTGDLNDVAWSETTRLFRKISGLLDPRIGRGMFNTFHADYWFMRWPLDHLFHSGHFTLSRIGRSHHIGSDHFALFTELVLEADPEFQDGGIEADEDDVEWAEEKAKKQNVSMTDVPKPEKK